eukprot:m.235895 g.235895  ORF g.235895 m.235895 type:complete len:262 (+) comp15765_c0_seq11:1008-1793(+)
MEFTECIAKVSDLVLELFLFLWMVLLRCAEAAELALAFYNFFVTCTHVKCFDQKPTWGLALVWVSLVTHALRGILWIAEHGARFLEFVARLILGISKYCDPQMGTEKVCAQLPFRLSSVQHVNVDHPCMQTTSFANNAQSWANEVQHFTVVFGIVGSVVSLVQIPITPHPSEYEMAAWGLAAVVLCRCIIFAVKSWWPKGKGGTADQGETRDKDEYALHVRYRVSQEEEEEVLEELLGEEYEKIRAGTSAAQGPRNQETPL